jgi:hypothetical protein
VELSTAALTALAALAGAEAGVFGLCTWLRQSCPWLIMAQDNRPRLAPDGLQRFIAHGWDAELGWVRKPNSGHDETGAGGVTTSYRIGADGARVNPGFEDRPVIGLAIGDSYTFSRQVNDDETWPHMLSRALNGNVANLGVGNYGADQALLRLEREIDDHAPRFVIMGVVPETIARIHSSWKHFSEYGNTFAFKPRFLLEPGGALRLVPNPVDTLDKFNRIEALRPQLEATDYFYETKFRRDLLHFPYLWRVGRTWRRTLPLMAATLGDRIAGPGSRAFMQVMERNIAITADMFRNPSATDLFRAIVARFAATTRAAGAEPVFAMLPQLYDLRRIRRGDHFYADFMASIADDVAAIDLAPPLLEAEGRNDLYIDDRFGGHLSRAGNAIVADWLNKALSTQRSRPIAAPGTA